MRKTLSQIFRILLPFLLGGGILYWMYRELPFSQIRHVMFHEMRWEWMFLSFIPGILAQVFRGLRWRQTLEPLGEQPRRSHCIYAIFLSYATSLFIPRVGEFLRCGVLSRYDGTSFPKAVGTVITERAVDSLLLLLLIVATVWAQLPVFIDFFDITGMSVSGTLSRFTQSGILVSLLCVVGILLLAIYLLRRVAFMQKVRSAMRGLWDGIRSVRNVKNIPAYLAYSVGIWAAYFFHYYLTFLCFDFTTHVGLMAGLVSFCTGTIAVLVPTPNGAGPWHFAVKTILVLYGLTASQAIVFALIVHTVQTLLVLLLGVYAFAIFYFIERKSGRHVPLSTVYNAPMTSPNPTKTPQP